jgi:hypothetical protein
MVNESKPKTSFFGENSKRQTSNQESAANSANDISIASFTLIGSLKHTERSVFYLTYWEDVCLPAVHPMFRSASFLMCDHPMLKDAILALSSCNMSRLHPENTSTSRGSSGPFQPNLTHQTRSQLYYSSAIKRFSVLSQDVYQSQANLVFTILVLFAHIESSMGNIRGFYCHVQGLANLFLDLHASIEKKALKALLTAWMQVRFGVWWARSYFSSLEVYRHLPPVPLPRVLELSFSSIEERRIMALSIMCESHRLNFKQIFNIWPYHPEHEKFKQGARQSDGECDTVAQLAEQARKSDEWLFHLPAPERPIDQLNISQKVDLRMPVVFKSHDAALNFAYYVVGRIMQSAGYLCRLQSRDSGNFDDVCSEEESWIHLLLRIARGTKIQTSITRNNYTIGFSGLLLAATLRCHSLALSIEIQDWLESLKDLQPTEEGAFPVDQSFGVAKAINQQRMRGRQIFGVTQPVDDGGGIPKFTAYNSQSINTLLFHGRCQTSGRLFTDCVSIDL